MKKKSLLYSIIGILFASVLMAGICIGMQQRTTAKFEWKNDILQDSYSDAVLLRQDYEKNQKEFYDSMRNSGLSVKEQNKLLVKYRNRVEEVLKNSTVTLQDTKPSPYEEDIRSLQEIISYQEERLKDPKAVVSLASLYKTKQKLKWLQQDPERAYLLEAWREAADDYFSSGFWFNESSREWAEQNRKLAVEKYNDPGELPEDFVVLLDQIVAWQREFNRLARDPAYKEYRVGRSFNQMILDAAYDILLEDRYGTYDVLPEAIADRSANRTDVAEDVENALKKAIKKNA